MGVYLEVVQIREEVYLEIHKILKQGVVYSVIIRIQGQVVVYLDKVLKILEPIAYLEIIKTKVQVAYLEIPNKKQPRAYSVIIKIKEVAYSAITIRIQVAGVYLVPILKIQEVVYLEAIHSKINRVAYLEIIKILSNKINRIIIICLDKIIKGCNPINKKAYLDKTTITIIGLDKELITIGTSNSKTT